MNIVFLSDTFGKLAPYRRLLAWTKQLPVSGDDKITLYFFDYVLAHVTNDEFLGSVMGSLDSADLIVACGPCSISQMEGEDRVHFRMPDLVRGSFNKTYIRSQLNALKVVIDTIRHKKITY